MIFFFFFAFDTQGHYCSDLTLIHQDFIRWAAESNFKTDEKKRKNSKRDRKAQYSLYN